MGSLNDYGRFTSAPVGRSGRGRWGTRLLRQTVAAAALFLVVASSVQGDGWLGEAARYVAGEGLAVETSWVDLGAAEPVSGGAVTDGGTQAAGTPGSGAEGSTSSDGTAVSSTAAPVFTAPASGVVVSQLAVAATGFATEEGILIQGSPGQSVRAAAAGSVGYLGSSEDGYIVELVHEGGFKSVYQNLSQLQIGMEDSVSLGQEIGITESGEVTFSLLKDGVEVDPLHHLFQQEESDL